MFALHDSALYAHLHAPCISEIGLWGEAEGLFASDRMNDFCLSQAVSAF